MIIKSYILDQNIRVVKDYNSVLFYGENEGIKNDFKENLIEKEKEFEIIKFFQDELLKNNNLLFKTINTPSLFNSKKIIFIYEVSEKLHKQLLTNINFINQDTKIIIFAGNLDKKSKIRNFFEKEKKFAAIACYEDNDRTLINYISNKLKGYKGLSGEIINLIMQNSYQNRNTINAEIIKIKNYFLDKTINEKDMRELLNIKDNSNFDKIRDASLLGDKIKVNKLIGEMQFLPEDNFYYLNQMNNRITKLVELSNININTKDSEIAIDSIKPKIFWKDKPTYILQMRKWNTESLKYAMNEVSETEILMKKNSYIKNDILIKQLLVNLCKKVSSFV